MGCGASAIEPGYSEPEQKQERTRSAVEKSTDVEKKAHEKRRVKSANDALGGGDHASIVKSSPPKPMQQSIAFDVSFDNNVDKIILNRPPKRLQNLEPLKGTTLLTAEALQQKQMLAEQKREHELNKKKERSVSSRSRLHKHLNAAKDLEVERKHQQGSELDEKQMSAGKKRQQKLEQEEAKRKRRARHAQFVRERAQRMKNEGDVEFDIEKDETYNDGQDSWLDGKDDENVTSDYQSEGDDDIYSSKSKKRGKNSADKSRSAALSASTTDSFDYTNHRTFVAGQQDSIYDSDPRKDDFFDS